MRTASAKSGEPRSGSSRIEPFVRSKLFSNLFAHGMELVEQTAGYLDNEGRRASRNLSREAALSYAGTSMRLTTRLMQIASWLLVLRAVREGEISASEARQDKYRIGPPERRPEGEVSGLPDTLLSLIAQTDTLYARIARLDRDLFQETAEHDASGRDAAGQLAVLRETFGD